MTDLRPKKSLGQNFLTDKHYIFKILSSFCLSDDDTVLEIGPGLGVLTKELVKMCNKVYACEIDSRMYEYITSTITDDNFTIFNDDFLKFDLSKNIPETEFSIVGNLPYHITSAIIFKVMDHVYNAKVSGKRIKSFTIMVQREIAERLCSKPNCKEYGVITVLTDFFAKKELLFHVPPNAFNPPPKVTSSILRFTFSDNNPYFDMVEDYKFLKTVIKTTFLNRRKMLRNTLKNFTKTPENLTSVDITKRPENLSLDDFIALTEELKKVNS